MSRSYKHTPIYTCGGCAGGRKYWKRQANKKVRKAKILSNKSNNYKKISETWDICDYRFYMEKEDDLRQWQQAYYRK